MKEYFGIFGTCCNKTTIEDITPDLSQCQMCKRIFTKRDVRI